MPKKKLPDFKSEKEEGQWYKKHRDELDDYFDTLSGDDELQALLAELPERSVAIAQAKAATEKYKKNSVATSIRLSKENIEAAKKIAAEKGLRYQTWIKSVIYQAIATEKKARTST